MIMVRLIGGLGNQLFQYAAGRRLALHHKTTLKLDITDFASYTWHAYSLKPFAIDVPIATPEESAAVKYGGRKGLSKDLFRLWRRLGLPQRTIFSEPKFRPYNPAIVKSPPNVYLDGFWQSEKYFADIADIIRAEVTIKVPQDETSQGVALEISNVTAVSIHIRRGNYVSNAKVNRYHGTCSLDYYHAAVRLVAEKVSAPHFFVFSDDPTWTKENLHIPHPTTYVTHNDAAHDYEDLRLMSLCQHFILANSSFSWWGAWLGAHRQKIIVAPKKWFNDPAVDTRDLIPAAWIRV